MKSACGGQVIDVSMTFGAGFLGHYEHISTVFNPTVRFGGKCHILVSLVRQSGVPQLKEIFRVRSVPLRPH
jgi:hypothetical protein